MNEKRWHRRKADRPTEILEAALEVFRERGVSAATFEEIAKRAGVTRGTIYLYYKNKREIFQALSKAFLPQMPDRAALSKAFKALPVEAQLREVLRLANAAMTERRAAVLLKLVVGEAENFPDIAQEYRRAASEAVLRPIIAVIERGQSKGVFRPMDPFLAARLALAAPAFSAVWNSPWNTATAATAVNRWDVEAYLSASIDLFVQAITVAGGA